ncbi:MAG: FIST signal transduction protein [Rhodothermia bacterium]
MKVVVGHSEDVDSESAIEEVLDACAASLNGITPQAGLLYVAIDHDFQLILDRIMARYPDLELVGCTTDGEISSTVGFAEDSVVLMLFHSDSVHFGAGIGESVREGPALASQQAVAMASEELEGPVCGGLAGDQVRFDTTYQFYKSSVLTNSVPVLLFAGPLNVSAGVDSGWEPLGGVYRITHAEGPTVYTIDDKPASEVWLRFFGSLEFHSYSHTVAVFPNGTEGEHPEFYLSAPAQFNEDGSMTVLNPIPQGAQIRLADATRDQIVAGAAASIGKAADAYPGEAPDAALIYSCAGRRVALGTRVSEESKVLQERLAEDVPVAGFYTYGEFCPLPSSPKPQSHGCTFVTVLIGEC